MNTTTACTIDARRITASDIQRAVDALMDNVSLKHDPEYVLFVHPNREYAMRREWAREHGSPVRQHATARGQRARRRARLWSWHPNPMPVTIYGVSRKVVQRISGSPWAWDR